jgi:hypothetical protein
MRIETVFCKRAIIFCIKDTSRTGSNAISLDNLSFPGALPDLRLGKCRRKLQFPVNYCALKSDIFIYAVYMLKINLSGFNYFARGGRFVWIRLMSRCSLKKAR